MKAVISKSFKISGKEFKKGEIADIPVSAFHKLSLKGLVRPYNPDVSEEELPFLKLKFEKAFSEHFNRLKQIPVSISRIKERYPEVYKKLRSLERQADEAYLSFDYDVFVNTLKQIEEVMSSVNEQKENPVSLDRRCVNCGADSWLKAKPTGKTLITCTVCGHSELHIPE